MTPTLFLPGAGGSAAFWRPVATRLGRTDPAQRLSWPGLGDESPDPRIASLGACVGLVVASLDQPSDLVAQSMGGLIALKVALARPDLVRRLVLVATSGGVPVNDLGGLDWRSDYFRDYPKAARWIADAGEDLSASLPAVVAPTLLIWGDRDPISPVAVGERLRGLLPAATLHVIPGGDHDVAVNHADAVAALIGRHLA